MSEMVKDLIQYVGISDDISENASIFKQLNVEENFYLPHAKPDIEQLVKVIAELEITCTKVIKTPKGTSLEGQKVTGWKLVVEGVIKQKVQYVADEAVQSVHAAHFNMPFSTYIILPENYVPGKALMTRGYIEDIYAKQIGCRSIFKNITILLTTNFN